MYVAHHSQYPSFGSVEQPVDMQWRPPLDTDEQLTVPNHTDITCVYLCVQLGINGSRDPSDLEIVGKSFRIFTPRDFWPLLSSFNLIIVRCH